MGETKEINIKNQTHYFFDDMIDIIINLIKNRQEAL